MEYRNFSDVMSKLDFCAKLDINLNRLSQMGSNSRDAALQMWRIESNLTLSADLIGVENPEKDPLKLGYV